MTQRLTFQEFMTAFCDSCTRAKNNRTIIHYGTSTGKDVYDVDALIPVGCREIERWRAGQYRSVWVNDSEYYTITYFRGDIFIVVCPDADSYKAEIVNTIFLYLHC